MAVSRQKTSGKPARKPSAKVKPVAKSSNGAEGRGATALSRASQPVTQTSPAKRKVMTSSEIEAAAKTLVTAKSEQSTAASAVVDKSKVSSETAAASDMAENSISADQGVTAPTGGITAPKPPSVNEDAKGDAAKPAQTDAAALAKPVSKPTRTTGVVASKANRSASSAASSPKTEEVSTVSTKNKSAATKPTAASTAPKKSTPAKSAPRKAAAAPAAEASKTASAPKASAPTSAPKSVSKSEAPTSAPAKTASKAATPAPAAPKPSAAPKPASAPKVAAEASKPAPEPTPKSAAKEADVFGFGAMFMDGSAMTPYFELWKTPEVEAMVVAGNDALEDSVSVANEAFGKIFETMTGQSDVFSGAGSRVAAQYEELLDTQKKGFEEAMQATMEMFEKTGGIGSELSSWIQKEFDASQDDIDQLLKVESLAELQDVNARIFNRYYASSMAEGEKVQEIMFSALADGLKAISKAANVTMK